MNKTTKRILIGIIVLLFIIVTVGGVVGTYFYNLALNPNTDKSTVLNAPHNMNSETESKQIEEDEAWFKEIGYKDSYLQSYDELKLHAYEIPNKNQTNQWVVMVHGYVSEAANLKSSAKHFYDMGFNVLMPDCRGHGGSEGDYIGMGWHDRLDVISWIDQIIQNQTDAEIVLYGVSMGGATIMMVSGEDLPVNVKAIVEDCGYTSVKDEFAYQLKQIFGLPSFPILDFASIVTYFRAGYTLGEANAVEQVAKSKTPMLFIHGDNDTFVPYSMMGKVYDAAKVEKEKFIVKGAGHGEASKVAGEEYWKKVSDFIDKYLQNNP